MDTVDLTPDAQALLGAMDDAAQRHAANPKWSRGYSTIHESQVGGLAAVQGAIDELSAAGLDIRVSAGGHDRYINAVGRVFSVKQ